MTGDLSDDARLRTAHPADAASIAMLHAESWRSAYRGIYADAYLDGPVHQERDRVWTARFAGPSDRIVILAEAPDRVEALGFCCIEPSAHPVWGSLIDNLHLRPGLGRRGLGRRILREAASRLTTGLHAATAMHLTVLEQNAPAVAAYERWGGREVERSRCREPDGQLHPIRRYAWASPAALIEALDRP